MPGLACEDGVKWTLTYGLLNISSQNFRTGPRAGYWRCRGHIPKIYSDIETMVAISVAKNQKPTS